MSPTLNSGDYIICIKPRSLRSGFIYVINHGDLGRIVKRLNNIQNNHAWVFGDNQQSTPEAVIGPVGTERIIGRAIVAINRQGIKWLG